MIDFKENTANKNLFKSIKKLENFSETFQKFERPFEWIVNEEEIDSDNYIKDWKNNE